VRQKLGKDKRSLRRKNPWKIVTFAYELESKPDYFSVTSPQERHWNDGNSGTSAMIKGKPQISIALLEYEGKPNCLLLPLGYRKQLILAFALIRI
jgi:hypothetical protein